MDGERPPQSPLSEPTNQDKDTLPSTPVTGENSANLQSQSDRVPGETTPSESVPDAAANAEETQIVTPRTNKRKLEATKDGTEAHLRKNDDLSEPEQGNGDPISSKTGKRQPRVNSGKRSKRPPTASTRTPSWLKTISHDPLKQIVLEYDDRPSTLNVNDWVVTLPDRHPGKIVKIRRSRSQATIAWALGYRTYFEREDIPIRWPEDAKDKYLLSKGADTSYPLDSLRKWMNHADLVQAGWLLEYNDRTDVYSPTQS